MTYRLFRQNGVALFVALMFLLILSLVAVVALQSTVLEVRMSNNQTQQMTTFQASESLRLMTGAIVDANTNNRGNNNFLGKTKAWANQGGSGVVSYGKGLSTCDGTALPAAVFDYSDDTAYTGTWHSLSGVFSGNQPSATVANIAGNPDTMMCANFGCTGGASACGNPTATAWSNVYSIGTRLSAGYGVGATETGTGQGIPSSGSTVWFEIRSHAQSNQGAAVVTTAEYRHPIQP